MIKKGLAVAVILLFIGVAFAIPINANVSKSSLEPIPDLDCIGDLYWIDVEPGSLITGNFIVENIGESLSELNWEIESYPDWGTWTLTPDSGIGLKPEDGWMTIEVEVVAPDEIEDDLWGEVLIVNLENSSDFCIIDAWIRVKSIDDATTIEFEFQRIKELVRSINLREIIVNPDAVVDTLEEILSIIEENEDCGCGEDSSEFKWFFPVICTLLVPIWTVIFFLTFIFGYPVGELIIFIGLSLHCYWIWTPDK